MHQIPHHRQAVNRCVQSPKKFRWKFWILILQKSEKFGAEIWQKLFWKKYSEKYFSQNKIEKINAWKICSWKSSNWKKLLFIIEKNRIKLFEKQPKIFSWKWKWRSFDILILKFWQIFLKISEKTAEKWKIALHTTAVWRNWGFGQTLKSVLYLEVRSLIYTFG